MYIKPPFLKAGSTIGIVAPASWVCDDSKIDEGISVLKSMGFNAVEGKSMRRKKGYLAGDDYERASDINDFFRMKDIDGIICLRGGYGSLRILDKLDYKLIKDNPKVFVGYSDITAIHAAIGKLCSMVTFHGPMVYRGFSLDMDEYTKESFLKCVASPLPIGEIKNPPEYGDIKVLYKGEAYGRLTGGNLATIVSTIGTPYEIDTANSILLLEDIDEQPYKIDRMLTQLLLSGKLKNCAGIVLGQWTDCDPKDEDKSMSLMEVFEDRLLQLKIPILYNLPFGHGKPKLTLPLGAYAKITEDGKFIIY